MVRGQLSKSYELPKLYLINLLTIIEYERQKSEKPASNEKCEEKFLHLILCALRAFKKVRYALETRYGKLSPSTRRAVDTICAYLAEPLLRYLRVVISLLIRHESGFPGQSMMR